MIQGSIVEFQLVMPEHCQSPASGSYRSIEGRSEDREASDVQDERQQSEMSVEKSESDSNDHQSDDAGDEEETNPCKVR